MKNRIPKFDEFLNEANLSNEALKFKKGDAIIVTKPFNHKDIDFKLSATSWFGSHVAATNNFLKNSSREVEKDDVLFIFSEDGKIEIDKNGKPLAVVKGYQGGYTEILQGVKMTAWDISSYEFNYDYNDFMLQLMFVALHNGWAKIIKYSSFPADKKEYMEGAVKYSRLSYGAGKYDLIHDDMHIVNIKNIGNDKYILSGYNSIDGKKIPDVLISKEKIYKDKFYLKDKTEVTGDLFDNTLRQLFG
ncbi:MAG: hypothetical protein WC979_03225 [Candidatus Pacearchaeota archaeon]|jgi:hypothetical protein|nr:hypothetical protein [Clostridia bacterium]